MLVYLCFSNSFQVSEITGFELTKISVNCSCYTNTDFLAVHDDHMGDRMVAFVYYLTGPKGWDSSKGGCLDLFSKDEIGHPDKVVKSIMPKNNQFVFFPVTNDSYHQVCTGIYTFKYSVLFAKKLISCKHFFCYLEVEIITKF